MSELWTFLNQTSERYSLIDVFSLFHKLLFKIKNIWSPPGIEPRTACLTHKCSATELQQPAIKIQNFISINTELECLFRVKNLTNGPHYSTRDAIIINRRGSSEAIHDCASVEKRPKHGGELIHRESKDKMSSNGAKGNSYVTYY